jgi:hypothetical protein
MKPYNYCFYKRIDMTYRFSIFWAMVASVIFMTLLCPANTLCIMSKEILMSFNNGGMDLLPDVRVINAEGNVTYTIDIKGQKKDRDDIYTADLTAEETYTRNSSKARVNYRAWGKYVYDSKAYDDNGRPCRSVTTFNIQDNKTILDLPANSYAMVGMYTSKKKGIARFKLPDFAGGFAPHYTTRSSGCNSNPSESGEFLDIEFLSNLPRIPSFGTTKTDFAQSLNYYEEKATEELSGFVETTFDGKRSRGSKTFDLINGMTLPYLKASGEEVQDSMWKGTLTISWDLGEEGETTIRIVSPKSDEDQVFKSGKLVINAEAKVEPEKYKKDVRWEIQDIQGSKKTIKPEKGANVKITFDKLPSDNNQFGEKTITASVNGKQDQVKIRVFFERDTKDNPEGKDPNWFYYWKQGAVAGLKDFTYKTGGSYYDPRSDHLVISDEAKGGLPSGKVPLKPQMTRWGELKPCTVQGSITLKATDGVYSAARVVAHELEHQRLTKLALQGRDGDGDLVPDNLEKTSPFCLDPKITNTHSIAVDDGASGDSEVLAIDAESRSSDRVKRELDWASPGSQSKK